MKEVTDPQLLDQLNSSQPSPGKEVTDPNVLAQLNSDQSQSSAPPTPATPARSLLNMVSDAVGNSPLGMVSKGANTIQSGLGIMGNAFPVRVPPAVQQGAQSFFSGARAAGVGAANLFANPGANTSSDFLNAADRAKAAYQPSYKPANLVEKVGSFVGENAPVAAATALSPTLGGPLAMLAQQAQTGKVSPVPLAMGLLSKASAKAGNVAESVGKTMEDTGQKMATGIANVLPNTVRTLANRFSENGNPAEAGSNIGQKLISDGVLGNDIGDIFNNVQSKQKEAGQMVSDALKAIKDESDKYGEIENPLQQPAATVLKPLQEQADTLAQGRLSGTRAMGTPINQLLKSFEQSANENNGLVNFDDVDAARKEVGQLWSNTPNQSPKFALYSKLYGTLADIRNNMVESIAANAHDPEIATNLQKANSEFHFYDSVLNDVTKGAAKAGVGSEGLSSAVSGKMGQLGALYALARGDVKRAAALGIGGKVLPMLEDELSGSAAKEMVKTGSVLKKSGSMFQNVPQAATASLALSHLTEEKAREYLDNANGDKNLARQMAKKDGWRIP